MIKHGSVADKRKDEPLAPVLEFSFIKPWPKIYYGQKFGPSLIRKSLKAGLYVMAEIPEVPVPVVVTDVRWIKNVPEAIEVLVMEGWRIPNRIWTVATLKGLKL